MKERPIGFKQMLIPAILDNRKKMTRRTKGLEKVNENPDHWYFQSLVLHSSSRFTFAPKDNYDLKFSDIIEVKCPYGQVADRLWVRETFSDGCMGGFIYASDRNSEDLIEYKKAGYTWKPSIFMPKRAARQWLEITDIRVERLQDISKQDAINEGIDVYYDPSAPHEPLCIFYPCGDLRDNTFIPGDPVLSFYSLWESINGKSSWQSNPWVWVITFKKISP